MVEGITAGGGQLRDQSLTVLNHIKDAGHCLVSMWTKR